MEPPVWHNLVVRLWRDGEGLKVRFLASQDGRRPATLTLATSLESATRQFEEWLRSIDVGDRPQDQTGHTDPSTQEQRNSRRGDDVGSTGGHTADS